MQANSRPAIAADCAGLMQAFHWFANEAAVREMHRVLRPQGLLVSLACYKQSYACT